MAERKVSVRLAAVGGKELKADLVAVGREGKEALRAIDAASAPAGAGLQGVGSAGASALKQLEQLSARASRSAQRLRELGASTGAVAERVNMMTGVSGRLSRSSADIEAYGRALDNTRAKFNPIFAVHQRYRQTLAEIRRAHATGAIGADEMTAAIRRERQAALASIAALKGRTTALTRMTGATRNTAFRLQQMSFQLNDIGVSLAGGLNPFTVLAQQGTQIAQIYGFGGGGVGQALRDVGRMITGVFTRFPLVTAAVAAAGAAVAGMTYEINQAGDVSVSLGDTMLATFQIIRDGVFDFIRPAVNAIAPWFAMAWEWVVNSTKAAGNAIINAMRAAVFAIGKAWEEVPAALGRAIHGGAGAVVGGVENLINGVIERINGFIARVNDLIAGLPEFARPDGPLIGALGDVDLPDVANPYADRDSVGDVAADIAAGVRRIMGDDPLGEFFDDVARRAREIATARREVENGAGGGRTRTTAEERDAAAELIGSLERELAVMRESDPIKRRMIEYSGRMANATDEQRRKVEELVASLDREQTGFAAIPRTLTEFAEDARRVGDDIGGALTQAFDAGSEAIAEFVRTGRISLGGLVQSMIADFARLASQRFIFGPLADGLSGALAGAGGGAGGGAFQSLLAGLFSADGGGHTGPGARSGGLDGKGGFLAMLHPQERVIDEYRGAGGGGRRESAPVTVNIHARDAESFRRSRAQIAADIQRAVAMGRRAL